MANYRNIKRFTPPEMSLDVLATASSLLKATDWTQLADSGLTSDCVAAFKTYRASIRTIRKTNPDSPTWPDAPTEEWS
jgi:hypothetical protein